MGVSLICFTRNQCSPLLMIRSNASSSSSPASSRAMFIPPPSSPSPASHSMDASASILDTFALPSTTHDADLGLPVAHGHRRWQFMRSGKRRPCAVRDYPDYLPLAKDLSVVLPMETKAVAKDLSVALPPMETKAVAKDLSVILPPMETKAVAKDLSVVLPPMETKAVSDCPPKVKFKKSKSANRDFPDSVTHMTAGVLQSSVLEPEENKEKESVPPKLLRGVVQDMKGKGARQEDNDAKKSLCRESFCNDVQPEERKRVKRDYPAGAMMIGGIRSIPHCGDAGHKENVVKKSHRELPYDERNEKDVPREPAVTFASVTKGQRRSSMRDMPDFGPERFSGAGQRVGIDISRKRSLRELGLADGYRKLKSRPVMLLSEEESKSRLKYANQNVIHKFIEGKSMLPASLAARNEVKISVMKKQKPVGTSLAAKKAMTESLRLFYAVRRKVIQYEEKKGKRQSRTDVRLLHLLKDQNLIRADKFAGSIPGLDVGAIFFFRIEISFVRVHFPHQAGIDYLTLKYSKWNAPVAVGIVSNVGQDGEDSGEELIYFGQGGKNEDNKQIADQKMEKGNLALDGSRKFNVPVRLIRGIKDANSPSGKVYVYDGLYSVLETFIQTVSHGFKEYRFRLRRIPGQPEIGSDRFKLASELKSLPLSSRMNLVVRDISNGKERQPICVENTVDEDVPSSFDYVTKVRYPDSIKKPHPSRGCNCDGPCIPSARCSCFMRNGQDFPYLNGGLLVRERDYVFQCGDRCSCHPICTNRTYGKGPSFRLEVFKTENRGWGVRSLDTIPAGSYVCDFTGKMVFGEEITRRSFDNEDHILDLRRLFVTRPRWGDAPNVFPDRAYADTSPGIGNPELIIDATYCGNVARFINHSCSPNLLVQKVLCEHDDVRFPEVKLYAMDNIPPLTELTYDYGPPTNNESSMPCLCGSLDCRGRV